MRNATRCWIWLGALLVAFGPARAELHSLALPALEGVYGGVANASHSAAFDFGGPFPVINRAWVHVTGVALIPSGTSALDFHPAMDGVDGPLVHQDETEAFDLDVPLPLVESQLDGNGSILMRIAVQTCCDRQARVDTATLWFESELHPGVVRTQGKISDTQGGFDGILDDQDRFGGDAASPGDLDGDGIDELAVGAFLDDDGGNARGAVWILFLDADGTVRAEQKISDTEGGFGGGLADLDVFGASLAGLGDLDGDGVGDLAVGSEVWDTSSDRGAVWVLRVAPDGTVKGRQRIADGDGGFTGMLDPGDVFGWAVASPGDLDGDRVPDLAVGAPLDDDGGSARGAVWILFLETDGTVRASQKISDTEGDFSGALDDGDVLGAALAPLGDLDGDGVGDLAAGAYLDDDGGASKGAVWLLFLRADGTVRAHAKISATEGGFVARPQGSAFGSQLARVDDLDGDGVPELVVSGGGASFWLLFLNPDGTVKRQQPVGRTEGGFTGLLGDPNSFGASLASLRGLDGTCMGHLAVGDPLDDDGGTARGAEWILFLEGTLDLQVGPDALSWCTSVGTASHDIVRGDLAALRAGGGDFESATEECLAPAQPGDKLDHTVAPAIGEGFWFLARQVTVAGGHTYDTGASAQAAPRDATIAASGVDCP